MRSHFVRTVVGHIGNTDTGRGRGLQVDVVNADRGLDDGQATRQMRQHLGIDPHIAHQQRNRLPPRFGKLLPVSARTLDKLNV